MNANVIVNNLLEDDWLEFVQKRLNELHDEVFNQPNPRPEALHAYFAYHKILNQKFGRGRDLSNHPRNPTRQAAAIGK